MNTQSEFNSKWFDHPYKENRSVQLLGSGHPTLGYIAAQIGAMDGGMPDFVKRLEYRYYPPSDANGPFGSYAVEIEFTKEAYPGQYS